MANKVMIAQRLTPAAIDFSEVFSLLKMTEPVPGEHNLYWKGPYFVSGGVIILREKDEPEEYEPKAKELWFPTSFVFMDGSLFCTIYAFTQDSSETVEIEWDTLDSKAYLLDHQYERSFTDSETTLKTWQEALPQIITKLRLALENPDQYNAAIDQDMPEYCREGRLMKKYAVTDDDRVFPSDALERIEELLPKGLEIPPIPRMTVNRYIEFAGLVYDALIPKDKRSPLQRYTSYADFRHGGMLDIPPENTEAFRIWFTSGIEHGSHPFEIIYHTAEGLGLIPHRDEEGWVFRVFAGSDHMSGEALMATEALIVANIPVELIRSDKVLEVLKLEDYIDIGPYPDQTQLWFIKQKRPDSVDMIEWKSPNHINPISREGSRRLAWTEKHGSLSGYRRKKYNLAELVSTIGPDDKQEEVEFGGPVGKEV